MWSGVPLPTSVVWDAPSCGSINVTDVPLTVSCVSDGACIGCGSGVSDMSSCVPSDAAITTPTITVTTAATVTDAIFEVVVTSCRIILLK